MNAGEACGVQLGSRAQDDANAGTHAVHRKQLRSSIQQLFTARQLLRRRANAKVEVILRITRGTRQCSRKIQGVKRRFQAMHHSMRNALATRLKSRHPAPVPWPVDRPMTAAHGTASRSQQRRTNRWAPCPCSLASVSMKAPLAITPLVGSASAGLVDDESLGRLSEAELRPTSCCRHRERLRALLKGSFFSVDFLWD